MTRKLTDINVTSFAGKDGDDGYPPYVTIGGVDALGKRIEPLSVPTMKAVAAFRRLLEPAFKDAEELAIGHLNNCQAALATLSAQAEEELARLGRGVRGAFAPTVSDSSSQ